MLLFKKISNIHGSALSCCLCLGLFAVCFWVEMPVFIRNATENQTVIKRLYADMTDTPPVKPLTTINLIINTYMRSGSSFIGKIFSKRKDTFYVYEPLWKALRFQFYSGADHVCHYSQQQCVAKGSEQLYSSVSLNRSLAFLAAIMNCSFTEDKYAGFLVDTKHFKTEFPDQKHSWSFYKSWDGYKDCASSNDTRFKDCLKAMVPVCVKAKYLVSKVLRTSLDNLEILLKQVPNLKIIQSFRDPRGIINSRLHTPFYRSRIQGQDLVESDVIVMCNRIKSDLETARKLVKLYPGRIRIIQYEDLWNLTERAKLLYSFVGMSTEQEVTSLLSDLAEPNSTRSGFHPYDYQKSLNWPTIQFADLHCSSVIKDLGYPIYQNETMYRNSADGVDSVKLAYTLS